jgi:hypothetical protein
MHRANNAIYFLFDFQMGLQAISSGADNCFSPPSLSSKPIGPTVMKRNVFGLVSLLLIAAAFVTVDGRRRPGKLTNGLAKTKTNRLKEEEAARLLQALLPPINSEELTRALNQLSHSKDKRFIAPLIDFLRFVNTTEAYLQVLKTLRALTGEELSPSEDAWEKITIWYGQHAELQPPPGYTGWKGELHARLIDPRFKQFLYDDAPAIARVEEVVWGGVRVDGIPALVNPRMKPAAEADYLIDREPVFGVSINGDNRAYPLRILDWHEMANDVVGGQAVALAYCTLCGSGVLYDSTAGGQTFQFGSSGFLMRSNKLMYDRVTNTLWNQLTGEPVIGKLVGSKIKLTRLPIMLTSWGEWRGQHPDTKVVDINTGYDRLYQVGATYGRYFADPGTMFPVWQQSRALPHKARVYALLIDGRAKAYPLDELNRAGGVVNDALGSRALVISYRDAVGRVPLPAKLQEALRQENGAGPVAEFANELSLEGARSILKKQPELVREFTAEVLLAMPTEARLTLLHERTSVERQGSHANKGMFTPDLRNEVAQRGLIGETRAYERAAHTFAPAKAKDELLDERGQIWRVTEEALVGPKGERLPRLSGHLAYWFGWFSYYPKTEVFKQRAAVKTSR